MGGYYEVYTSLFERRGFSYANIRKASYTGSVKTMINNKYSKYSYHQLDFSVQVLDNWRNLPLYVFSVLALRHDAEYCISRWNRQHPGIDRQGYVFR